MAAHCGNVANGRKKKLSLMDILFEQGKAILELLVEGLAKIATIQSIITANQIIKICVALGSTLILFFKVKAT